MAKSKLPTDRRLTDKQLFARIYSHTREEDRKRFRSCKRAIGRAKKEHTGTLRVAVPDHRAAQILVKLITHPHNGFGAHYISTRIGNIISIEVVITLK